MRTPETLLEETVGKVGFPRSSSSLACSCCRKSTLDFLMTMRSEREDTLFMRTWVRGRDGGGGGGGGLDWGLDEGLDWGLDWSLDGGLDWGLDWGLDGGLDGGLDSGGGVDGDGEGEGGDSEGSASGSISRPGGRTREEGLRV